MGYDPIKINIRSVSSLRINDDVDHYQRIKKNEKNSALPYHTGVPFFLHYLSL